MRLVPRRELAQEETKGFQFTHSDIRSVEDKLDKSTFEYNPTRALDTVYTNGGKLRFVSVCMRITITTSDNSTLDGYASAYAAVEDAATPTQVVARCRFYLKDVSVAGAGDFARIEQSLTFLVPANENYTVVTSSADDGAIALLTWEEWDLH